MKRVALVVGLGMIVVIAGILPVFAIAPPGQVSIGPELIPDGGLEWSRSWKSQQTQQHEEIAIGPELIPGGLRIVLRGEATG